MIRGFRNELSTLAAIAFAGAAVGKRPMMAGTFGLFAAVLRIWPIETCSLEGSSVLITGGSRGLGLALAENFLKEGANIAILARDQEEIDRARVILEKFELGRVLAIRCDVTNPDELESAVHQVENEYGKIDVLVNNAGTIAVGPFESMEASDFEAMMELQLHAVVKAVQLVIPSFLKNGQGRIVNISSVGGKIAVPHMTTYCAGKFALAGFSEALAAELAQHNIRVTTVYPGLMQTGSPKQAVFKGDCEKEYAWFQSLDVSPLSVSADYAAKQVIKGVKAGDTQIVFPFTSKLAAGFQTVFPETFAALNRNVSRFMLNETRKVRQTGAQSRNWLEMQSWYQPLKKVSTIAETTYNQQDKSDANFNLGL